MTSALETAHAYVAALRASHDRVASLVADLDEAAIQAPSYDSEWSIGQVLSHMGSQAQIFELFLEAGLGEHPVPGNEVFSPIWAVWDAKTPLQWRDDVLVASATEVATYESLDDATIEGFRISMFGMDLDVAGLARMRLAEHAVHAWDVAVSLDPTSTVRQDAVDLLVDGLGMTAARGGKPQGASFRVRVGTTDPQRDLVVSVGETVSIDTAEADDAYDGSVDLPAEAFLRLVYGRLDPDHTPAHTESGSRGLADLRTVFPGF
jgi:uncharacterized protein (TIGR03083 family)